MRITIGTKHESEQRPRGLLEQVVVRRLVLLHRHDRGGAVHHHHADAHEQQRGSEQHLVALEFSRHTSRSWRGAVAPAEARGPVQPPLTMPTVETAQLRRRSAGPSGPADNDDIVKGRLRLNRNKPRRTARHVSILHKTARQWPHASCGRREIDALSSQQSSAGRGAKTPPSQTGAACVPSGRFFTAPAGLMTAHCSRATFHSSSSRSASCLNTRPRSRVVAEHVEARARRREHDHAAWRRRCRTRSAPRRACRRRRAP